MTAACKLWTPECSGLLGLVCHAVHARPSESIIQAGKEKKKISLTHDRPGAERRHAWLPAEEEPTYLAGLLPEKNILRVRPPSPARFGLLGPVSSSFALLIYVVAGAPPARTQDALVSFYVRSPPLCLVGPSPCRLDCSVEADRRLLLRFNGGRRGGACPHVIITKNAPVGPAGVLAANTVHLLGDFSK